MLHTRPTTTPALLRMFLQRQVMLLCRLLSGNNLGLIHLCQCQCVSPYLYFSFHAPKKKTCPNIQKNAERYIKSHQIRQGFALRPILMCCKNPNLVNIVYGSRNRNCFLNKFRMTTINVAFRRNIWEGKTSDTGQPDLH